MDFATSLTLATLGHASLIMPPARNSIDSELPAWSHGKHPETALLLGDAHLEVRGGALGLDHKGLPLARDRPARRDGLALHVDAIAVTPAQRDGVLGGDGPSARLLDDEAGKVTAR